MAVKTMTPYDQLIESPKRYLGDSSAKSPREDVLLKFMPALRSAQATLPPVIHAFEQLANFVLDAFELNDDVVGGRFRFPIADAFGPARVGGRNRRI